MRVIVCGSRSWRDRAAVEREIRSLPEATVVVHGAHWEGADAIADEIAHQLGLPVERHPADWQRFGRSAGPRRNEEMAASGAALCIAFRSRGTSRGTDDMIARAVAHGISVRRVSVGG